MTFGNNREIFVLAFISAVALAMTNCKAENEALPRESGSTECGDGRDNDRDGLTDCDDDSCQIYSFCSTGTDDNDDDNGSDSDSDGDSDNETGPDLDDTDTETGTGSETEQDAGTDTDSETDIDAGSGGDECYKGDFAILSLADRRTIKDYTCIEGSLTIEGTDIEPETENATLILNKLESITGNFVMKDNPNIENLDLSMLTTVGGDFIIDTNEKLETAAAALGTVGGDLIIDSNDRLETIAVLDSLTTVGHDLIIQNNADYNFETINLMILSLVGNDMNIINNRSLETIVLDNLTTVGNDLNIKDNPDLVCQTSALESQINVTGTTTMCGNDDCGQDVDC